MNNDNENNKENDCINDTNENNKENEYINNTDENNKENEYINNQVPYVTNFINDNNENKLMNLIDIPQKYYKMNAMIMYSLIYKHRKILYYKINSNKCNKLFYNIIFMKKRM